jgi:hypothetical protein
MPKLKIDTSLFEPLTIEVGDAVYTTVPFTDSLLMKIQENHGIIEQASAIFGRPVEEFAAMDVRLIKKLLEAAADELNQSRQRPSPPRDNEKNAPTPEGGNLPS